MRQDKSAFFLSTDKKQISNCFPRAAADCQCLCSDCEGVSQSEAVLRARGAPALFTDNVRIDGRRGLKVAVGVLEGNAAHQRCVEIKSNAQ